MAFKQAFIPTFQEKVNICIRVMIMQLFDDRCGKDNIADGSGLYDEYLFQDERDSGLINQTGTSYSLRAWFRDVFVSVDFFRFPMIRAQGT